MQVILKTTSPIIKKPNLLRGKNREKEKGKTVAKKKKEKGVSKIKNQANEVR